MKTCDWPQLVMDTNEEEKNQGFSSEAAHVNFAYQETSISFIDVPGNLKYLDQASFGIGQARVAVLVVSSLKTDIDKSGKIHSDQLSSIEEHLAMLKSHGISKVIVAVNKMD
jgi:translation elongation factor EF-1alpha